MAIAVIRILLFHLLCATAVSTSAMAQASAPQPIVPETLTWFSPPGNPLLRATWVLGAEKDRGTYVLRVALTKGGRIPAHTHPDTRYATVLSGTLHVGFGENMDDSSMVAVPAGAVYVVPANVPHALSAPDGDVTYQEAGTGPTATVPVGR